MVVQRKPSGDTSPQSVAWALRTLNAARQIAMQDSTAVPTRNRFEMQSQSKGRRNTPVACLVGLTCPWKTGRAVGDYQVAYTQAEGKSGRPAARITNPNPTRHLCPDLQDGGCSMVSGYRKHQGQDGQRGSGNIWDYFRSGYPLPTSSSSLEVP